MPTPARVVVTQRFFEDEAIAYLQAGGCEVVVPTACREHGDGNLSRAELAGLLAGASGWIIGQARVDRALLQDLPDLRILSRRGVGTDRIDLAAAADLGRVVTIAAGGNHDAVADHTMALMLAVLHRLRETQQRMERGIWTVPIGRNLYRKTVGLVGFGRIARSMVRRLSGFEAEVLVAAGPHHVEAIRAMGARAVDVPTLLRESDIVSLHAPLVESTRFLVDAAAIATMKPNAIVVNTARGGLVHDGDLLDALRSGRLAGAGLDVFISEGDATFRAVTEALIAMPSVVTTPHSAGSSREAIALGNRIASDNVLIVLGGGMPSPDRIVVAGRA